MAAITPTLIQTIDVPSNMASGSSVKRLVKIYIEVTSTGATDTLDLASYVSGLQGILGIGLNTLDDADASNDATLNTYSGTVLTFDGHAGSGVWKIEALGYQ